MKRIEDFITEMRDIDSRTIKVDIHETDVIPTLEEIAPKYDMDVEVQVLETGDYAFRNVGIERKEKDFLEIDDVLAKVEELKRGYDKSYLMTSIDLGTIIEEDYKYHNSNLNESLKGLTASLVARGVEPIFCPNKEVMCEVMCKIFDKVTDGKDRNIEQPIRPQPNQNDWELYILSSLPKVGEIKARNLRSHFGDVRSVMKASPKELREVSGIGPTIAERINEVLTGQNESDGGETDD